MTRDEVREYIEERYSTQPEYPWVKYPRNMIFRHSTNQKWFALVMPVAAEKLGLRQAGELDILNLKSTPVLIGSFLGQPGIFPAYHMSKTSWLSVALDGSVTAEKIKTLLEISYDLTEVKRKKGDISS